MSAYESRPFRAVLFGACFLLGRDGQSELGRLLLPGPLVLFAFLTVFAAGFPLGDHYLEHRVEYRFQVWN